jgi:hypothetical protein
MISETIEFACLSVAQGLGIGCAETQELLDEIAALSDPLPAPWTWSKVADMIHNMPCEYCPDKCSVNERTDNQQCYTLADWLRAKDKETET